MDLQSYLDRICFNDPPAPTLDVLGRLLAHHVQHIPFENLDVQLGTSLTTSPAEAFDKIVNNQRGGWCYEQNGLFGWALNEIGFEVMRVAAAVLRAERGDVANDNHLCLLVSAADSHRTYLADVGFGGSMVAPIPLEESGHAQAPFRIGLRLTDDGHWRFWEDLGKGEFTFDFRPQQADEEALQAKCDFLQTDASSGFVQNLVAQIRLPDAHKTVRGKVFRHVTRQGTDTRTLESVDDLVTILHEVFSLDVPGVADLWPRIDARHEEFLREQSASRASK